MKLVLFFCIILLCENVFSFLFMCVKKYSYGGRISELYSGINNVCKNPKYYAISCNIFGKNCDYCDLRNGQDENEIRNWCDKQGGTYESSYCYPLSCANWCSPDYERCYKQPKVNFNYQNSF